jgi:hypothetical protein
MMATEDVNRPDVAPVNGVDTVGWCPFEIPPRIDE